MLTDKEINILLKSLWFIKDFPQRVDLTSGQEFLTIHNRNVETLKKLSYEKNSEIISKKLEEYDEISKSEIDEYIRWKRKDDSILSLAGGKIVDGIFQFFKKKGNTRGQIKQKLIKISEINEILINIIENPYLEKLMTK